MAAGAFSDREAAIGPGCVVLAVGPSGAGKDALLSAARSQLVGDLAIVFVERVISRPPHAAEAHASLSTAEFLAAAKQAGPMRSLGVRTTFTMEYRPPSMAT
ncbi:MAG: hypothetical protein HC869_00600 [Rhodospirillales bacterium]|nr:hypothetical protein [Rhodospirillales bacterium]